MIAIAFALPQESRDFVAAMRAPVRSGLRHLPIITGKIGTREVIIFHTGVGAVSARDRLLWFWGRQAGSRIESVISSGFAGGLDLTLPAGRLILAENYPDQLAAAQEALGERVRIGPLATVSNVLETPEAKADVVRQSGAIAVDMETAILADFFSKKGVPFLSLRVISDAAEMPLPVPSDIWFDERAQTPQPLRLLRYLQRHPAQFFPFIRFVDTIRHARKKLTKALIDLILSDALAKNKRPSFPIS